MFGVLDKSLVHKTKYLRQGISPWSRLLLLEFFAYCLYRRTLLHLCYFHYLTLFIVCRPFSGLFTIFKRSAPHLCAVFTKPFPIPLHDSIGKPALRIETPIAVVGRMALFFGFGLHEKKQCVTQSLLLSSFSICLL